MRGGVLLVFFIFVGSQVKGASKYYDGEVRPYEFGYNLEGNQHRHEKKDDKGLIMGEFGFITADGVYHLTEYATDENGNFKILSMKNIKIGLPGEPGSKPLPESMQPPPLPVKPALKQPKPSNRAACSSCRIPETESGIEIRFGEEPAENDVSSTPEKAGQPGTKPLFRPLSQRVDARNNPISQPATVPSKAQQESDPVKNSPRISGNNRLEGTANVVAGSAGILYKFNYTVGYHQHHEQGDAVGAKDGGYYFVGRDGLKRTIDYQANEFGYQPHLKLTDADPQDVPREETEKEAGLKGYEFKWFNTRS